MDPSEHDMFERVVDLYLRGVGEDSPEVMAQAGYRFAELRERTGIDRDELLAKIRDAAARRVVETLPNVGGIS